MKSRPIHENPFIHLAVLLALTLIMFCDVLFAPDVVVSMFGADLSHQFVHWREFGFRELKNGNFPLWNPHIFSGAPYFSGFQSAMLYPPNYIHLVLPFAAAVNFLVALHVFMMGAFMYACAYRTGLHAAACLFSAVAMMFSGAFFLHIMPGHLSNLSAMVWAPLIFLAIDGIIENPSRGWILLGVFAVAMQIFAGHPQYVFYTAVAAAIYAGLKLVRRPQRLRAAGELALVAAGAFGISAVQLISGMDALAEGIRGQGLSFAFASSYSLPPENFLLLVSPFLFGNMTLFPYWGQLYFWEMCPFIGAAGLTLAAYGLLYGRPDVKKISVTMFAVLAILALGSHTPLFSLLYHWVPGFDKFRGMSKFIFPATLFLVLLAGAGLDGLIRSGAAPGRFANSVLAAGVILGGAALALFLTPPEKLGVWNNLAAFLRDHRLSQAGLLIEDPFLLQRAAAFASGWLSVTAVVLALFYLLLRLLPRRKKAVYAVVALAAVELFVVMRISRPVFDIRMTAHPQLERIRSERPGDYRILNLIDPNAAMSAGLREIWGYDPGVQGRYGRMLFFSQGLDPDAASQNLNFSRFHPILSMLRCRYYLFESGGKKQIAERPVTAEHIQAVGAWETISCRDAIFARMDGTGFDPRKTVFLETDPFPGSVIKPMSRGKCSIIENSTDHFAIEADTDGHSILLITDSYSRHWKARPLSGSAQDRYQVQPANYALIGIPMNPGKHRIRLEYSPDSFHAGKWISLFSLAVFGYFLASFIFAWKRERRNEP
ncbi:MAG TPA: hypothetical protein PK587_05800 [Syntrophales bacterium]|nr:hypothetical protein [Syntrophales bacterium]